jgi:hypothetical protein
MGKDIFRFLLKALGFSVVFWLTSIVFIWCTTDWMERAPAGQAADQGERLAQAYDKQIKRSSEQLDAAAVQRRRMDALLSQWEEQTRRHELVLQKWEQASGTARAAAVPARSGH